MSSTTPQLPRAPSPRAVDAMRPYASGKYLSYLLPSNDRYFSSSTPWARERRGEQAGVRGTVGGQCAGVSRRAPPRSRHQHTLFRSILAFSSLCVCASVHSSACSSLLAKKAPPKTPKITCSQGSAPRRDSHDTRARRAHEQISSQKTCRDASKRFLQAQRVWRHRGRGRASSLEKYATLRSARE